MHLAIMATALMAATIPLPCSAEGSAGEVFRTPAYAELKRVSREMDTLPLCEGHRRFAEATGRYSPARSCSLAYPLFNVIDLAQNEIVRGCDEFTRKIEAILRQPNYCQDQKARRQTKTILAKFEADFRSAFEASHSIEAGDPQNNFDDSEGRTLTGEYQRIECLMALEIGMEIRRRQSDFLSRHRQMADYASTEECPASGGENPSAEYLRVITEGELGG